MLPVVITVFDSESNTSTDYSFTTSPIRIGRNALNDLSLPFPFVSGWHAVVRFDAADAKFFDLGSTNGTLHNGLKVQAGESVLIGAGVSLAIGKLELRIRRDGAAVPEVVRPPVFQADPAASMRPTMPTGIPDPHAPMTAPAGVTGPPGYSRPPLSRQQLAQAPLSQPPLAQPQLSQPPLSQPPLSQPPLSQPPVAQPPMSQPPGQAPLSQPPGQHAAHPGLSQPPLGRPTGMPGQLQQAPLPGARPTSTPPSATAAVDLGDIHQSVHRLRPRYDAYRQAWQALYADLGGTLGTMPPEAMGFALSILQRELPDVAGEAEFQTLAAQAGVAVDRPRAASSGNVGGSAAIERIAQSLCPGEQPPRSPADVDRFMSCVEDVLRASARAFVELQRGQEQFGNEMGVRTIKEYTALHAAGSPENVLKYLLDWQSGGPHRTQELVGVYADLMIHQVALINGVMEGVRSLLARLSPQEIERGVSSGWPTRAAATWKQYVERHREASEDKTITATVFGPEFARAYAEVGGEGSKPDGS